MKVLICFEQDFSESLTRLETAEKKLKAENELYCSKSNNLEVKIANYEKRQLAFLENSQRLKQDIEESDFQKNSALEREKHLLRQIEKLNTELQELPKKYLDTNEAQVKM